MKFALQLTRLAAATAFSATMMAAAHADTTLQVSETGLGPGLVSASLVLPVQATAANYWAGFQTIKVTNGSASTSFQAFCIDPFQWASSTPSSYTLTGLSSSFDSLQISNITKLFNYAYAGATTNLAAAAMQLALWEVANDDGNLLTGAVQKTNSTNASLVTATNNLLDNYANASSTPLYNFSFYKSAVYQDFVTVTAVPEPQTYAMLLAGLGLIGTIARRRKSKQA